MPHTRLTSTRAPRPHGTPQEQPAARSEAFAPPEALEKASRAKEHDAVKARGLMPGASWGHPPRARQFRLKTDAVRVAVARNLAQTGPAFFRNEKVSKSFEPRFLTTNGRSVVK